MDEIGADPEPEPGSGWRAVVRDRARALQRESPPGVTADPAFAAVLRATQAPPRPPAGRAWWRALPHRIAGWFVAREEALYGEAMAALLHLRSEALVESSDAVLAAHAPRLRAEVKRLVPADDPSYDRYLHLLDRLEATQVGRRSTT